MKKCNAYRPPKTCFPSEREAGRVMMRIWSHDTQANIYDLHVYACDYGGKRHYHIGHKSYYEMSQKKLAN